jgi:hypothetical protein
VIVVELTTVNDETEFAPNFTDVAFEKLVPVMVTVLPKTAELGALTFELAKEVRVGNEFVVTVDDKNDAAESR